MKRTFGKPLTVAIHWPRFGPYHLARLNAAFHKFQTRGLRVVGLETASQDQTYEWREVKEATDFERCIVFPGRVYESISWLEMWQGVNRLLTKINPTVIAVNGYSTSDAWAAIAWARMRDCPVVLMSETKRDDAPRSIVKEAAKRIIVRQFRAALCGGTPHRAYLKELGMRAECIFLGYDAVDNQYFSCGAEHARQNPSSFYHLPGLEPDAHFFLASARFIRRKNMVGLLEAYCQYRQMAKERELKAPWRLVVLGDGEERDDLEKLIQIKHVEGVTLAGFRQIHELPAYYGLARVFIHPAVQEQWGLVVNEAMASGLPVLVSERCGCVQNLVQEGKNGFAFDPENTTLLAELMHRCSSGQVDLSMFGYASKKIISSWGPERFAQGLFMTIQSSKPI
jgi:glycosyltransferase involved in cell wall biosynthesis